MIYLDHAATTPLAPPVLRAMIPHMTEEAFGNASSSHARGRSAAEAVSEGRRRVASLLGTAPSRVVFTSGATEALNTALKGLAALRPAGRDVFVVSAIEHKAVLDTADYLERTAGVKVVRIAPTSDGSVPSDDVKAVLEHNAGAVAGLAVMAVNNETGVIQDVRTIAEHAATHGVPFVCDSTQAAGWRLVDLSELPGAVFATVSAHKLHGPQGIGALVVPPKRTRADFQPLIHGGGHQRGMRSGTLNVAGIVGFGVAAERAREDASSEGSRIGALARTLREKLVIQVNAEPTVPMEITAPHIVSVRIPGVDAEALIANCPTVAFASGSACKSAVPTPSHVLTAMGRDHDEAEQTIRLSLGRPTTVKDVERAAELIARGAERIRELSEDAS